VVRVTGNFVKESPLHPKAQAALAAAFDAGWADPKKLSQVANRANRMRAEATESLAHLLTLRIDEIEVLGEPLLGHYLSIAGFATGTSTNIFYGATSRSEIIATARSFTPHEIAVGLKGDIQVSPSTQSGIFALQIANGETGVIAQSQKIVDAYPNALIACDATTTPDISLLPNRWDSALFDSQSWAGPAGIAILGIRNSKLWKNPFPHIGIKRVPQSYSLPLLLSSVVALEAWRNESELRQLNQSLRARIAKEVHDCDIAGDLDKSLASIASFSFLYCHGEELVRALALRGFDVDSGSACTSDDLAPSHVLAAMGVLTHGNIRITLHDGSTQDDIDALATAIIESVAQLRAQR